MSPVRWDKDKRRLVVGPRAWILIAALALVAVAITSWEHSNQKAETNCAARAYMLATGRTGA